MNVVCYYTQVKELSEPLKTSTIPEQDLRGLQNSAFLFAEMGLSQAEQHLLWQPVYTLFFVCLALVIVQGSTNYYVHMCTLC